MIIEKNKNLLKYNFYNINSIAKYFVELKNENDFIEIFDWIDKNKIKKYEIIGLGANVIFVNKFYDGLIIKVSNNFVNYENEIFEVGAGKNWDNFLLELQNKKYIKKNFYNIQALSLIPGTVGAGAYGNIGAFGTEIKKYIKKVKFFNIKTKKFEIKKNDELEFSYRNSFFKKNDKKFIIFSVFFDFSLEFIDFMNKKYKDEEYFSLEHFAKKHKIEKIKENEIRKNIIKIRKGIYPDIKKFPNVGSTFKNAEISKKQFDFIVKKYPDIPNWYLSNDKIKIPTAYIFDKILKIKGKVFGNIKIHENRPLFFINMGNATGEEFFNLCNKIKKLVKEKIDIDIEEEVKFINSNK